MPTEAEHVGQAEHNERFFYSFNIPGGQYLDWATTALFYVALHYVRAVAARYHTQIRNHPHAERVLNDLPIFVANPQVHDDYRQLKDDSEGARYNMRSLSRIEVEDLRDNETRRIRTFARDHLGV